jgi:hypothetical protein
MALLFAVIGLVGGVGYHLNRLQELSFAPDQHLDYANATVSFSATFNPLVYPFYWFTRNGYVDGSFYLVYFPEAYGPGEFGGARWGLKPSDRYDYYTITMITWGFWLNLLTLLFIMILIEAEGARILYLTLFSGILGFYFAQLLGVLAGLAVGLLLVLFLVFKLPKDNVLFRFWNSLWE